MAKSGLNLKNMANRRFSRTEEKIFIAYFASKAPTIANVTKTAHISRATLYRHHHHFHAIVRDYEKYLLRKYFLSIRPLLLKNHTQLKTLILKMLIFIMSNKIIFKTLISHDHPKIIEKLIHLLEPKLSRSLRLPSKIIRILTKEIAAVIEEWSKTNFAEAHLTQTLSNIIYLISTARTRLGPLNQN